MLVFGVMILSQLMIQTANAETIVYYDVTNGMLEFDTDTGEITGYTGSPTDVIFLSTISGVDVTCIGDYAFAICLSLTSITIPGSVTSIESSN